ncbi:MAG TPA: hypothetical protein VGO74_12500, partial [Modestobacter sp.]|nr:hypothetical protein [Modestobacter sp.]
GLLTQHVGDGCGLPHGRLRAGGRGAAVPAGHRGERIAAKLRGSRAGVVNTAAEREAARVLAART